MLQFPPVTSEFLEGAKLFAKASHQMQHHVQWLHARPVGKGTCAFATRFESGVYLGDHLVVGVPHEGNALQGGSAAGQQGHVGRHTKGDLHGGAYQVL